MPELPWRAGYSGQTVHELVAFEEKYRKHSLVLAFEQAIDQGHGPRDAQTGSDFLLVGAD